ncbi:MULTISPECIES: hypothetical protein [unclassified Streptomyces]|uniref:hypothetical protein n=1 Tax=unclassified Streptomyces TaxID=2593676 RepID=UPI002E7FCB34|nr:hypothetical protein [Streptomyces sp. NBC_00589]WTI36687.1 hypothetical protein OIC96_17535 [Streptomyces sp. NBC_00775]WUB29636.1 hypothetical protein OHA51_32200 [Streptomyces sp. NBC_00589]
MTNRQTTQATKTRPEPRRTPPGGASAEPKAVDGTWADLRTTGNDRLAAPTGGGAWAGPAAEASPSTSGAAAYDGTARRRTLSRPTPTPPTSTASAASAASAEGTPASGPAPAAAASGSGGATPAPLWQRPVKGRHRRPRPRRVLFAVGGLALAAGVLSLVRMTPESMIGGGGSAEAEPTGATVTDAAGDAVTTVKAVPSAAHPVAATATAVMGGAGSTPTPGVSLAPTAPPTTGPASIPSAHGSAPAAPAPDATGIPTAPMATPPPPAATTPAATQPAPGATTHAPAPGPGTPGVCVPIVGICVNGLTAPLGHR